MTESTYVNDVIGQEDKFDGRQGVIPGREDVARCDQVTAMEWLLREVGP